MTHMEQRYVVLLRDTPTQVWLAYDAGGRIGNANYNQAFQYETKSLALNALRCIRNIHAWPQARILGTLVEMDDE